MSTIIASNFQPCNEYQLSATVTDSRLPRTKWEYVRAQNGKQIFDPVLGFYFNPPPNAKCRWSTDNGSRPPQHIKRTLVLPHRNLVLWDDKKLQSEASCIREKHWEDMKTLVVPQQLEDLYEFFDSATLWTSGVQNIWNLVNLLAHDARLNWYELENQVASECNDWVLDWLESLPHAQSNRNALINWDQKTDILTAVTTENDWEQDLIYLDLVGQNILRECLLYHFERLTGNKPIVARFNTHAAEDNPTLPPNSVATAGDTTAKASSSPDDVLASLPTTQALTTIPEESIVVKTATKAYGLRIDTTTPAQIPHHTVSAPATALPRITVAQQLAKEAEDVSHKEVCEYSATDELLTTKDLADRLEAKARQLSSQKTLAERPESMPGAPKGNYQLHAMSANDTAGFPQDNHQPRHTFPERAGYVSRNTRANGSSFRGQQKSAQRRGPNRQQAQTNAPNLSDQPSALQQGARTGSAHQQHMMPAYGTPHIWMQQQAPGFIQTASPHRMATHSDGFTNPGLESQPGVGTTPLTGLPGTAFQNQMPIFQPPTEQPHFNRTQAPPMSMLPQLMGPQNVGAPMYQPNGYIPQLQPQPVGDRANEDMRHNDRRDSMNSTGSRNKVRDDPIHGPVYNLKARKYSNTSARRYSTNMDGRPAVDQKQTGSAPNNVCRNQNRQSGEGRTLSHLTYDECPCRRCVRASKSIFVKHEGFPGLPAKTALMKHLAAWGAVEVTLMGDERASLAQFKSDNDVIRLMQEICAKPDQGRNIPGLGKVNKLWYALFSKHFTNSNINPTGLPRELFEAQSEHRHLSSSQRRDSNPYRDQHPTNAMFNSPNFANRGPGLQLPQTWHGQNAFPTNLNMVPVPLVQQRELWSPAQENRTRKSSKTESTNKAKAVHSQKNSLKTNDEATKLKEDWRSKPPAEEDIEDISSEEVAAADVASNASSQGPGSINIRLPDETGSSRSRSASASTGDNLVKDQVQKESLKSKMSAGYEEGEAGNRPIQLLKAEAVVKDGSTTSSGYRKATSELAVPVEEFQLTALPGQMKTTEKENKKSQFFYSKVTSELTDSTETFDAGTVIRHKPLRAPLIAEWITAPEHDSNLQDRLCVLSDALRREALQKEDEAAEVEGTVVPAKPKAPETDAASTQKPKRRKKSKGGKNKESWAGIDASTSALPSGTPTSDPSLASNTRPASRASTARPESAAGMTTESPSHQLSATQNNTEPSPVDDIHHQKKGNTNKNNKSFRKRKQPLGTDFSAVPDGQAKTVGSQDQVRTVSGQESSPKKPKIASSGPGPEVQKQLEPEPAKVANGSQNKSTGEKQDEAKKPGSQPKAGGSLRPKKNRSPVRPPPRESRDKVNDSPGNQVPCSLKNIFEPPTDQQRKGVSPGANLFPNQKFTIDQVRKESSMAPLPNIKEVEGAQKHRKVTKLSSTDGRIALPLLPPDARAHSRAFAAVKGKCDHKDDPFTGSKGDAQSEGWIKDKTVRSAQKPSGKPAPHQTSPTPSPEKKADRKEDKKKLNAAAKTFAPSPIPSSPAGSVVSVLSVHALPFHAKKPSLPGQKGGVEQRFITPAEQVVDPTKITQPGPPAKEKKTVGSARDRARPAEAMASALRCTRTAAEVAAAANAAPKMADKDDFPTLETAASVPQKRAASLVIASMPAVTEGHKTVADKVSAATGPKPRVKSPNNVKLGQKRGDASAAAADEAAVGEKDQEGGDQWTTVGSSKKAGGKSSGSSKGRSAPARSSSSAAGPRGRVGGQGIRGGRVPVGEERKGG